MKVTATQLVTALALATLLASEVEASKKFVKLIPNGGNVPDTPAIGHSDGTGESAATNTFGDAFASAGHKWTKELCEADTDGDGQTNGQELGDPCCEWDKDTNPVVLWTTGVSHPDDASKTSDPSLWAGKCGSSTSSTTGTTATSSASTSSGATTTASSGPVSTATPSSSRSGDKSSAASGSNSQAGDSHSHSSSMHMNMDSSNNSTSSTGSTSMSGAGGSGVEVGSPSTSSTNSRSSIRSASSTESSASTPIASSSSSKAGATTSGATAVSPIVLTTAGIVSAVMAFLA